MGKRITLEEFESRLPDHLQHLEIVDLYYDGSYCLVRDEFGECRALRHHLIDGSPPTIEAAIDKNKYVKNQFIKRHGDTYNYDKVEYVDNKTPVIITCPIPNHGDFLITPNSHKNGHGCQKCGRRGWTLEEWISAAEKSKNFDSYKLYFIECWNDNERFYKIGITFVTLGRRFKGKRNMPYHWEKIKVIEGDAETIWNLEKQLHAQHKELKYEPQIDFGGKTECFTKIIE